MVDTNRRIPLWVIGTVNRNFLLWFIFWVGFIPLVIG